MPESCSLLKSTHQARPSVATVWLQNAILGFPDMICAPHIERSLCTTAPVAHGRQKLLLFRIMTSVFCYQLLPLLIAISNVRFNRENALVEHLAETFHVIFGDVNFTVSDRHVALVLATALQQARRHDRIKDCLVGGVDPLVQQDPDLPSFLNP